MIRQEILNSKDASQIIPFVQYPLDNPSNERAKKSLIVIMSFLILSTKSADCAQNKQKAPLSLQGEIFQANFRTALKYGIGLPTKSRFEEYQKYTITIHINNKTKFIARYRAT